MQQGVSPSPRKRSRDSSARARVAHSVARLAPRLGAGAGSSGGRKIAKRCSGKVPQSSHSVIEFTKRVGPTGASVGDRQQIQTRLRQWDDDWVRMRSALLAYANAHPSEDVRIVAHEMSDAIGSTIGAAWYLSLSFDSPGLMDAYNGAAARQVESKDLARRLMNLVRAY